MTTPHVTHGSASAAVKLCAEVLVVDDEPSVGKLLEFLFQGSGLSVRLASSGEQALEIYRDHQDAIGVVLLDVQMPGLDGPTTLKKLREVNPKVACCFMSGDTGNYTMQDLYSMGAAHVFSKPFGNIDRLKELLWEEIRKGINPP